MKKFIVRKLRKLFRAVLLPIIQEVLKEEFKNIRRMRQFIALESTARFVNKNLPKHKFIYDRLDLLSYAINQINKNIEGGIVCEFGVFKGNSINHIARLKPDEVIYGFDSFFNGMPETFIEWSSPKGAFALDKLPKVGKNVKLIEGYFQDSLPVFLKKNGSQFKFVHIDCDLYKSTKAVFKLARDRFKSGTVIVFDDYFNFPGWEEEEYKAFQEFIKESNYKFQYLAYSRSSVAVQLL